MLLSLGITAVTGSHSEAVTSRGETGCQRCYLSRDYLRCRIAGYGGYLIRRDEKPAVLSL
jgi:hypothetical protein